MYSFLPKREYGRTWSIVKALLQIFGNSSEILYFGESQGNFLTLLVFSGTLFCLQGKEETESPKRMSCEGETVIFKFTTSF